MKKDFLFKWFHNSLIVEICITIIPIMEKSTTWSIIFIGPKLKRSSQRDRAMARDHLKQCWADFFHPRHTKKFFKLSRRTSNFFV